MFQVLYHMQQVFQLKELFGGIVHFINKMNLFVTGIFELLNPVFNLYLKSRNRIPLTKVYFLLNIYKIITMTTGMCLNRSKHENKKERKIKRIKLKYLKRLICLCYYRNKNMEIIISIKESLFQETYLIG